MNTNERRYVELVVMYISKFRQSPPCDIRMSDRDVLSSEYLDWWESAIKEGISSVNPNDGSGHSEVI